MASRVAWPRTLGPPLYIAIQTHQPQPQLQHILLRSLRSLRSAYGLHAQKEQIDLLVSLGELFAPSSLSAVFGSFGLPALGSYLSKSRKTKAAKIFCRLRSPHTCLASRGAKASKLGPPLYNAMQTNNPNRNSNSNSVSAPRYARGSVPSGIFR